MFHGADQEECNDMKKMLFLILSLSLICVTNAQTSDNKAIVITQESQIIAVDPQENIYAVDEATLYKYAPDGTLLYTHTNNLLGGIASIDVDNPLKIMLFYRDAGSIVFLDDKLAPIGSAIDIFSKGYNTISLATYSTKNNLILYDETNTDLIILDFYFKEKERIHYNFFQFNPVVLNEMNEKKIYMQDNQKGIYFFDSFGTYDMNIAVLSEYPVQIYKDQIFYIKDGQLSCYNFSRLEAQLVTTLPENIQQAILYHDKLILSDSKTIYINHLK